MHFENEKLDSIEVDKELEITLRGRCKRQCKVQRFRQAKYRDFGKQSAEISAIEVRA